MKAAIAFVACAPFATWLTTAVAAHPTLVGLVPERVAQAGAGLFVIFALWLAALELRSRQPMDPGYRAGAIFGIVAAIASAIGFDPSAGIPAALVFCAVALAGHRVYRFAEGDGWSALVTAWLVSGIVLCSVALVAMLARKPALLSSFAHGRAIGIFENPNELALFSLAVCGVAGGAFFAGRELYRYRALALVAFALGIVTLAATSSRSGEAAFAIAAVLLAVVLWRRQAAIVGGLAAVLLALALSYGADRHHNPAENESRLAAWRAGIRTVALFPLTGAGVGAYYRIYPFVRAPDAPGPEDPIAFDPHDFYLAVAAETGLVGLAAFVWTIVLFLREALGDLKAASPPRRRFVMCVLAGLLAIGIHLLFNAFALAIVLWAVLAALVFGAERSARMAPE
ncbi:MAG: O-antigen ligase family protein [Vulcanimicrobiaceae bacterium]